MQIKLYLLAYGKKFDPFTRREKNDESWASPQKCDTKHLELFKIFAGGSCRKFGNVVFTAQQLVLDSFKSPSFTAEVISDFHQQDSVVESLPAKKILCDTIFYEVWQCNVIAAEMLFLVLEVPR